jgi:hypothetical protein
MNRTGLVVSPVRNRDSRRPKTPSARPAIHKESGCDDCFSADMWQLQPLLQIADNRHRRIF